MYDPVNKRLCFNSDGKFRILMISDFHAGSRRKGFEDGNPYSPKVREAVEALVNNTSPDFVMVGGDQCIGHSPEYLYNAMTDIMAPVIERGIPWAHVYGNHDREMAMSTAEQEEIYETVPLCLSKRGPSDIFGVSNFVLPVYDKKGEKPAYNLFALDSNREISDYTEQFGIKEEDNNILLPFSFGSGSVQAMPFFQQVMWYYNTSRELEKENGRRIPALMFLHNPIIEFNLIFRNPEETDMYGEKREAVCCSELNSGLFTACLERGDVKGIFCGHEHMNAYHGKYCGITLGYAAAVGYDMSAHDDVRGGRVIDISEDGSMETRHIKLMSVMGDKALRRPDFFEGGLNYFIRNTHL